MRDIKVLGQLFKHFDVQTKLLVTDEKGAERREIVSPAKSGRFLDLQFCLSIFGRRDLSAKPRVDVIL